MLSLTIASNAGSEAINLLTSPKFSVGAALPRAIAVGVVSQESTSRVFRM
jgi:hypothetical protein